MNHAFPDRALHDMAAAHLCTCTSWPSAHTTPWAFFLVRGDLLNLVLLLVLCTSCVLCPLCFSHLTLHDLLLLIIYISDYMSLFQKDLPWCPQPLSHHFFLKKIFIWYLSLTCLYLFILITCVSLSISRPLTFSVFHQLKLRESRTWPVSASAISQHLGYRGR